MLCKLFSSIDNVTVQPTDQVIIPEFSSSISLSSHLMTSIHTLKANIQILMFHPVEKGGTEDLLQVFHRYEI